MIFESLLAGLSASLLSQPAEQVDEVIQVAQQRVCDEMNLDSSAVFQPSAHAPKSFYPTHVNRRIGGPPERETPDAAVLLPWSMPRVLNGEVLCVRVADLPPEAAGDRQTWENYGVKSSALLPLQVGGGQVFGMLSFDSMNETFEWPQEFLQRLRLVAGVFAGALDRKRAAQELRDRIQRYELVIAGAQTAIWDWDVVNQRVLFSPQWKALRGYSADEIGDRDEEWSAGIHPADAARVLAAQQAHLDAKTPFFAEEYRVRCKDGSWKWIADRGVALRDANGVAVRMAGSESDITERRLAEQALKSSEEFNRTVLASLHDHIAILDRAGAIIAVNEAWRQFALQNGAPASMAGFGVGASYLDACHRGAAEGSDTARRTLDGILSVLTGARESFELEYPCDRPSETMWFAMRVLPLKRTEGGVVISHADITRRKLSDLEIVRQRNELAHLARVNLLGELSGSLAHELNQPLTAILSNAQAAQRFLASDDVDLDEIRDILEDIVGDDQRAGEVIRRLRLLHTRGEVQRHPLELNEVVLDVLRLIGNELLSHNVRLETELASGLPVIEGDRVQLQQVLLNLVVNATDAMADAAAADCHLVLRTELTSDGSARVSVADRGTGLGPEAVERLFEPYFTTKPSGMGLGLKVCRTIIAAHGGQLAAENNADKGATFHVTLPGKARTLPADEVGALARADA